MTKKRFLAMVLTLVMLCTNVISTLPAIAENEDPIVETPVSDDEGETSADSVDTTSPDAGNFLTSIHRLQREGKHRAHRLRSGRRGHGRQ